MKAFHIAECRGFSTLQWCG